MHVALLLRCVSCPTEVRLSVEQKGFLENCYLFVVRTCTDLGACESTDERERYIDIYGLWSLNFEFAFVWRSLITSNYCKGNCSTLRKQPFWGTSESDVYTD